MGKHLAIFSAIVFAVFAFVSCLYSVFGCHYSGEEFSPDDFSFRSFSYRYEPITGTVFSGRSYSPNPRNWLPNLVKSQLIKPVCNKEKKWDLVHDNGYYYSGSSVDSDARFLVDYLSLQNESGENTWTTWNAEHPDLAKVLWPLIAQMARDDMYLVLSDVFTFVLKSNASKPEKFQADLHQEVAKAYLKLGKFDFENNDLESAKDRISKSIEYDSTQEASMLLKRIDGMKASETPVLEAMPE